LQQKKKCVPPQRPAFDDYVAKNGSRQRADENDYVWNVFVLH